MSEREKTVTIYYRTKKTVPPMQRECRNALRLQRVRGTRSLAMGVGATEMSEKGVEGRCGGKVWTVSELE